MSHVIVEGLPAVGKSEALALLERFYPESVRVLPELVKQIVETEGLDLFRDRAKLTAAIAAALPARRTQIDKLCQQGYLCLEESHLGVHRAYSVALGDTGFVDAYEELQDMSPMPDAFVRLEIPMACSLRRQLARATPDFEVDAAVLDRMLSELDWWHADHETRLIRIYADRPAHATLQELTEALHLSYGASCSELGDTFDIILLLGRPASGKSEFIDFMSRMEARTRADRFHIAPFDVTDDFPILWERFEEDDIWEKLGCPRLHSKRCNGNYAVTDEALWGFLIEKINRRADVLLAKPGALDHRTMIIEFSRGGPTGYADALSQLSPTILKHAAILYVSVSFDESWRRNIARYDEKRRHGILTHSVPREEMEQTYGIDDWSAIAGKTHGIVTVGEIPIPYATMHNEPESIDPHELSRRYHRALLPLYETWQDGSPSRPTR